ncbi:MAG: orotidine 5'-phosphate decarboxylase / HUMPS family protein, partial [Anaeromyxobacteraceae bacterium]
MSRTGRERICAAVDFPTWAEAEPFARAVAPEVGMLKVGLELFAAEGPPAVRAAAALGRPVFLDLKLHDIPNTVEGAARSAAASGAALLTIHAAGGDEMVRAAVR